MSGWGYGSTHHRQQHRWQVRAASDDLTQGGKTVARIVCMSRQNWHVELPDGTKSAPIRGRWLARREAERLILRRGAAG